LPKEVNTLLYYLEPGTLTVCSGPNSVSPPTALPDPARPSVIEFEVDPELWPVANPSAATCYNQGKKWRRRGYEKCQVGAVQTVVNRGAAFLLDRKKEDLFPGHSNLSGMARLKSPYLLPQSEAFNRPGRHANLRSVFRCNPLGMSRPERITRTSTAQRGAIRCPTA
jgi:hypothetical protein